MTAASNPGLPCLFPGAGASLWVGRRPQGTFSINRGSDVERRAVMRAFFAFILIALAVAIVALVLFMPRTSEHTAEQPSPHAIDQEE